MKILKYVAVKLGILSAFDPECDCLPCRLKRDLMNCDCCACGHDRKHSGMTARSPSTEETPCGCRRCLNQLADDAQDMGVSLDDALDVVWRIAKGKDFPR